MKTLLICAFALPLIAACAAPSSEPDGASYVPQEAVYTTGSNLPTKQAKSSSVQTLSPEQARDMVFPVAPRGPNN
jgi:hypothetical protein